MTLAENLAKEFYSGSGTVLWESLCLLSRGKKENLWNATSKETWGPVFCSSLRGGSSSTVQCSGWTGLKLIEVFLSLRLNIKVSKECWILFYGQLMLVKLLSFVRFCMLCLGPCEVYLASQSLYLWKAHNRLCQNSCSYGLCIYCSWIWFNNSFMF